MLWYDKILIFNSGYKYGVSINFCCYFQHWASRNNHVDVCSWIVQEKQVNVDVVTDDGTTALHLAAYNGSLDTCKWLIFEGKSDINKVNVYGCNASQW